LKLRKKGGKEKKKESENACTSVGVCNREECRFEKLREKRTRWEQKSDIKCENEQVKCFPNRQGYAIEPQDHDTNDTKPTAKITHPQSFVNKKS